MRKLSSQTLEWPTDWAALFGAHRPIILEIGFGTGTYLIHLAQNNLDANVIGIEISSESMSKAEKAVERLKLDNVRVIRSPAETALHHLFEPKTISQIHINFPDPWFKSRHEHRRLMKRETIDAMVSRLVSGGKLFLATDILEYAEMSDELLADTPGLTNTLESGWVNAMPGRIVTKYEGKAHIAGRTCYYFAYQRNDLPSPNVPVIKDLEMPHIVFHSPLSLTEMLAQYQTSEHKFGETHIHLLYGYISERSVLFEVYVKEPTIDQRVALMLVKREASDEYTLRLGTLGHARVTEGIHKAVSILGDWLLSLHPENRVVKAKVQQISE